MKLTILKYLDLFNLPYFFYINGSTKRSSCCGLMFSLGIYIFIFYSFLQSDYFSKNSPIVVSQTQQLPHTKTIHFDDNKILILAISDASSMFYIDDSIFTVKVKYWLNASFFLEEKLTKCSMKNLKGNVNIFEALNLNKCFCLENSTFDLEGSWSEGKIKLMTISIFQCNNLTSNNSCKSLTAIQKFFDDPFNPKYFSLIIHDTQINIYDFESPFIASKKVDNQIIDPSLKKTLNYYLKEAIVETDKGTIFPAIKQESATLFDYKENDYKIRSSPFDSYIQVFLYSSRNEIYWTRRYQKLPETIASLFGTVNLLVLPWYLPSYFIIYISTLRLILSKLYIFPDLKKKRNLSKIMKNNTPKEKLTNSLDGKTKKSSKSKDKSKDDFLFPQFFSSSTKNFHQKQHSESNLKKAFDIKNGSKKCDERGSIEILPFKSERTPRLSSMQKKPESYEIKHFNDTIPDTIPEKNSHQLKTNQSPTNRKELTDDSFILEHYSEMKDSNTLKKIEPNLNLPFQIQVTKKESNVSSLPMAPSRLFRIKTFLKNRHSIFSVFKNEKKNTLDKFSYWDYIIYVFKTIFFMEKSPKEKLIAEAEKTYRKDMDVTNIVKRLHDAEKLKILLLDEDQLLLFNYLSKPMIKLPNNNFGEDENIKTSIRMSKLMNSKVEKNSQDVQSSFKKILRSKNDDKINQRLIDLFDLKSCNWIKE